MLIVATGWSITLATSPTLVTNVSDVASVMDHPVATINILPTLGSVNV